MAKLYPFDEETPRIGASISAFRTLTAVKNFASLQSGLFRNMKYWEIDGSIVEDEGGPDGITILVESAREIP